jgi:EAL domain-containing protein (putative c-di-GMP-specific phosphodiesterase class I)
VGFEALARWIEPDGSMLPPRLFIPVAEDSEVIVPMTKKLIADSLRDLSDWQSRGFFLKVSVNATVEALDSENFVDWLQDVLNHHQLSPDTLIIEITESRVAGKTSNIIENLTQLRQLGVGISVDDFGTGYSSLLQLSRMPCTELKIDRSFVSGASVKEERAVLLRNSVRIGHGLGLNVVAEGIETRGDWDVAAAAHVDEVQGWFIGKAQAPERVIAWIEDWENRGALLTQGGMPPAESDQTAQIPLGMSVWGLAPPSKGQLVVLVVLMALSAALARLI